MEAKRTARTDELSGEPFYEQEVWVEIGQKLHDMQVSFKLSEPRSFVQFFSDDMKRAVGYTIKPSKGVLNGFPIWTAGPDVHHSPKEALALLGF